MISSNTTSLAEVTGDGGWQVSPTDIPEITDALNQLTHDTSLNQTWVEKGKKRAQAYSWGQTAKDTLDVYRKVLNNHKAR